jgi:hypothetical protein
MVFGEREGGGDCTAVFSFNKISIEFLLLFLERSGERSSVMGGGF